MRPMLLLLEIGHGLQLQGGSLVFTRVVKDAIVFAFRSQQRGFVEGAARCAWVAPAAPYARKAPKCAATRQIVPRWGIVEHGRRSSMPKLNKGEHEFVSDLTSPAPSREMPLPTLAAGGILELDARGLSAPLPLLRAHRALREMLPGQDLRVITNYKASIAEFQAMVKYITNYELVSQDIVGEEYVHVVRKRR